MAYSYSLPPEIKEDLPLVEMAIDSAIKSRNKRLKEAAYLTFQAGGKRLRPALVLICGRVGNYNLKRLLPAALTVELIHTASLIHDDILDGATSRRGAPTINFRWDRDTATAVGDYMFATGFAKLAGLGNSRIIDIMAEASLSLSLGEWLELTSAYKKRQTLDDYLLRIKNKTASLFSACCRVGGLLSGAETQEVEALGKYGENLGMAFQIFDDVLDIWGDEQILGKPVGSDLREGIATMPVLYALKECKECDFIKETLAKRENSDSEIEKTIELISKTEARSKSEGTAHKFLKEGLEALEVISKHLVREELREIGRFVIGRNF